ncbi:unnamed protein product [Rotaria socialis]|uniref:Uncharacterized protein n=1 Tax=Rotaria socialis TaxID=392032 RepID=A0A817TVW6_9BILA|nr:unnamed protein product [Rotaria socialis]
MYSNILNYLSRQRFTVNCSNEIVDDFHDDLNHLNYILNHHKSYYKDIFYYLHKLCITCSLCIEYRQSCTNLELTNRFIYIRIDLLTNLKKLNEKIKNLLMKINANFEKRKRHSIDNTRRHPKEKANIDNLFRTILLWCIVIIFIRYYFIWPHIYEIKSKKKGWLI